MSENYSRAGKKYSNQSTYRKYLVKVGGKVRKATTPAVCRDCGREANVNVKEFLRAAPARCLVCGGMLDRKFLPRR